MTGVLVAQLDIVLSNGEAWPHIPRLRAW